MRELRQHLSTYLRRVAAGERLVVTERRRPVAMLGPLPEEDDILEYMIATGEATRPTGDLLDVEPLSQRHRDASALGDPRGDA